MGGVSKTYGSYFMRKFLLTIMERNVVFLFSLGLWSNKYEVLVRRNRLFSKSYSTLLCDKFNDWGGRGRNIIEPLLYQVTILCQVFGLRVPAFSINLFSPNFKVLDRRRGADRQARPVAKSSMAPVPQ